MIPSEEDWYSEEWDIDTPGAYERFGKKSLAAAVELFAEHALVYQEDLVFMPVVCFRFYVLAYIEYLMSPRSNEDSDGASCFLKLIEYRHKDLLEGEEKLQRTVGDALLFIGKNQDWYGAPEYIYGDFEAKALECLSLLGLDKD